MRHPAMSSPTHPTPTAATSISGTRETVPASNAGDTDPMEGTPCPLPPPKGGTMFRFFQIAPEKNEAGLTKEERDQRMARMFEVAGAAHTRKRMARHPSMHRTDSVDYIVLLKG